MFYTLELKTKPSFFEVREPNQSIENHSFPLLALFHSVIFSHFFLPCLFFLPFVSWN